jgi:hypothetical protein
MSPRTDPDDRQAGPYLTLGAGMRSGAPSTRGLVASVLLRHGLRTCASGILERARLVATNPFVRGEAPAPARICALIIVSVHGARPDELERTIRLASASAKLVIAVEAAPTSAMDRVKDEVTPVVMTQGGPGRLFGQGPMRTLTSDTTRRVGLVSNEDVAPTILHFFGIPVPAEMDGSPIRVVDAPPPFRMHARHLANRRTAVPLSVGMLVGVNVIGFITLFLVLRRRPPWTALDRTSAALPMSVPAVGTAALAAGSLPVLSYAWLIPFLILAAAAGAALGLAVRRRGPLVPAVVVAAGVIVFFVIEALRGWPDTLFPVLGGSALDGARFYGLPNTYIGVLAGAGVWLAASLSAYAGFVLLFALGLFAGFPDLGADLGGALTLFAAAGLWLAIRGRPRVGWREVGLAIGVVIAGMALVLAAQVVLASTPTHGTRFVQGAGHRSLVHTVAERLGTGWRLLTRFPLTWIIVAGLPVCLALALRPPGPMRPAYERHPEWRDAMVVLVLASIVAFVGNDTGAAAAGFGFGLAIAGILYLPLAERAASPT